MRRTPKPSWRRHRGRRCASSPRRAKRNRREQCCFELEIFLVRQRTQLINALRGHLAERGVVAAEGAAHGHGRTALRADERGPIRRTDVFEVKCLLAIDPIPTVYSGPAHTGLSSLVLDLTGPATADRAARRQEHHCSYRQRRMAFLPRLQRSIPPGVTQQPPLRASPQSRSGNRGPALVVFRTMFSASIRAPAS
jgi:hypothetical protein